MLSVEIIYSSIKIRNILLLSFVCESFKYQLMSAKFHITVDIFPLGLSNNNSIFKIWFLLPDIYVALIESKKVNSPIEIHKTH